LGSYDVIVEEWCENPLLFGVVHMNPILNIEPPPPQNFSFDKRQRRN